MRKLIDALRVAMPDDHWHVSHDGLLILRFSGGNFIRSYTPREARKLLGA